MLKNLNLITLFLIAHLSIGQNLIFDDFNYPVRDSLEGYSNWFRDGLNLQYNIKVKSPGLEYTDYSGSGKGNAVHISNNGQGDIVGRSFPSQIDSGSLYMSFMIQLDSMTNATTSGGCISFNPSGGTYLNTILQIKRQTNNTFDFGIVKSNGAVFLNSSFELHHTYLIVLKYTFIKGDNNDESSLYVFQNGIPDQEPSMPDLVNTFGPDFTAQSFVYLINNYAQTGLTGIDLTIDGLRVGTSWDSSVKAIATSVQEPTSSSINSISVNPNPVRDIAQIEYHIQQQGDVSIQIINASGDVISETRRGSEAAGKHTFILTPINYTPGLYFCKITSETEKYIQRFILVN
ncbi:MAG: T9SS type A sorting domain-containing protein [Saprospiraceae bacterium]|nr:T9SS type A sorting domain-containing protein [Saprospiraceae bacterium]HMW38410.1 T9SS type A sorting domain-containing protein [Saprospiraceae bacterium]HMX87306.1 T9SS type A sorting domain-containing protein [Saprospiraceae bacterium]HMZ39133.1 T9SS type A sorting domain-containing protein [Saprospiraceae bacterium]HNA63306.1 T9SS type A sorting domain-containing protein [Saprospiraceae bacterium]